MRSSFAENIIALRLNRYGWAYISQFSVLTHTCTLHIDSSLCLWRRHAGIISLYLHLRYFHLLQRTLKPTYKYFHLVLSTSQPLFCRITLQRLNFQLPIIICYNINYVWLYVNVNSEYSEFTIWISQTVYCYFWAYPSFYFLVFFLFLHFLVVGFRAVD